MRGQGEKVGGQRGLGNRWMGQVGRQVEGQAGDRWGEHCACVCVCTDTMHVCVMYILQVDYWVLSSTT